jgi:beta-lactamase superfamily II metal-dependent hydrolase
LAAWTNQHGRLTLLKAGEPLGPWTVLHPGAGDRLPQADDNALVLRGEFEGARLLLCSDLAVNGQSALLQRRPDLRADIVVAGLPKGSEPLHEAFLAAIQPRLIILADSDYPASDRASPRLKVRLARRGVPVLFLRESQAVTVELRRGRWTARSMSGSRFESAAGGNEPATGPPR